MDIFTYRTRNGLYLVRRLGQPGETFDVKILAVMKAYDNPSRCFMVGSEFCSDNFHALQPASSLAQALFSVSLEE